VILETLRMQTPLGILLRTCTRDYTLPGTQLHLRWGLFKEEGVFCVQLQQQKMS
jgi:hypothetical protein